MTKIQFQKFNTDILTSTKDTYNFSDTFIEKDYYLSILLDEISNDDVLKNLLIFKWWTCIYRWYLNYYRWSEDLDFIIDSTKLYRFEDIRSWFLYYIWNNTSIICDWDDFKIVEINPEEISHIKYKTSKDTKEKDIKLINYNALSKNWKWNLLSYLSDFIQNRLFNENLFSSKESNSSAERNFFNIFFEYNNVFNQLWLKNWKVEIEVSVKELKDKNIFTSNLNSISKVWWISIFWNQIKINCLNIHEILWEKIWALFWRWIVNNYEKEWIPRIAIRDFFDVYMINKHEKELQKSSNFQWIYSDDVFTVLNNKLKNDIRRWFYFIDIKKHKDFIKEEILKQEDALLSLVYNQNDHWFFDSIDNLLDSLIQFQENLKKRLWIPFEQDIHEWLSKLYQTDNTN